MREPRFTNDMTSFSLADSDRLRTVVSGDGHIFRPCLEDGRAPDIDFRRRYAAILLRERGL